MKLEDSFRSITIELESMRDRVRHLIGGAHWPTDGELKESVLRNVIARTAPLSITIGRGFIVSKSECSTQQDILIYDNSHPVHYRDGDLVFISPRACRAVIEVKTKMDSRNLAKSLNTLSNTAELIRSSPLCSNVFVGLFSYELDHSIQEDILPELGKVTQNNRRRIIDHLSLGCSSFIKYWQQDPRNNKKPFNSWNHYSLHNMAAGYFIHNLMMHLAPSSEADFEEQWFPSESKELNLLSTRSIDEA
jgi:hypothetical protein